MVEMYEDVEEEGERVSWDMVSLFFCWSDCIDKGAKCQFKFDCCNIDNTRNEKNEFFVILIND